MFTERYTTASFVRLLLGFLFFTCFSIVVMLADIRNRKSLSGTNVSVKMSAFVYRFLTLDSYEIKVVLADSRLHADAYLKQWQWQQGLENCFFTFVGQDDFDIVGIAGEDYVKGLLFDAIDDLPCV